jgi:hypothetical protein
MAFTVSSPQMPFAVFDSLPFIRRRDWIAFQFRLWVVASDDCRSCYCPESPSQLPFADFDALAPIRPSSQLAFIVLSRLFGLSLSDDCCGCNWQNGLCLSSPQMRFAIFHSRNTFRQLGLDSVHPAPLMPRWATALNFVIPTGAQRSGGTCGLP